MTPEQIEQLKHERAIAINALADIADMTIDFRAKQLAEEIIQRIKQ